MQSDFEWMDLETLQQLYHMQEKELEMCILSGNAWEVVAIKRKRLTELSKILHEKLQHKANVTPAEVRLRESGNRLEEHP